MPISIASQKITKMSTVLSFQRSNRNSAFCDLIKPGQSHIHNTPGTVVLPSKLSLSSHPYSRGQWSQAVYLLSPLVISFSQRKLSLVCALPRDVTREQEPWADAAAFPEKIRDFIDPRSFPRKHPTALARHYATLSGLKRHCIVMQNYTI